MSENTTQFSGTGLPFQYSCVFSFWLPFKTTGQLFLETSRNPWKAPGWKERGLNRTGNQPSENYPQKWATFTPPRISDCPTQKSAGAQRRRRLFAAPRRGGARSCGRATWPWWSSSRRAKSFREGLPLGGLKGSQRKTSTVFQGHRF